MFKQSTPGTPHHLRCENRSNPQGIDELKPRLSWWVNDDRRGARQTAFQILVASTADLLARDQGDLWDSGRVETDQSVHVGYEGRPLESRMACHWKLRVWDQDGTVSGWSQPALWTMGLLRIEDWQASWIGPDEKRFSAPLWEQWIWYGGDQVTSDCCWFRRTFELPRDQRVTKALSQVVATGGFPIFINGKEIGHKQLEDITHLVQAGRNVIAIKVENVRSRPEGLMAGFRFEFEQGDPMRVVTDQQWRSECKEIEGWELLSFDDSAWSSIRIVTELEVKPWEEIGEKARCLPARMLRREFSVEKQVARATAYISGLGLFELYLNGRKVGDHVLSPALTEYDKRVFYVSLDVTDQLRCGVNAAGVILGNGRYFEPRLTQPLQSRPSDYPKLLLQIEVDYADGSACRIVSDESWKLTTSGPIRANSEYDGEDYDARLDMAGWTRSGFDESGWHSAVKVKAPRGTLAAQMMEPMRVMDTLRPAAVSQPRPGLFIFDMGQNMVGWCRLKVRGPRGTRVVLRHAETLKPDGELFLDNIRSAKAMDVYTLKGEGEEIYEPRFTYHGFRYVEITGFPGQATVENLEGRVIHDALALAGAFTCSHPLLNQIQHNIYWGVRGNYRSIPTDCPQRDERLGWLGDRSEESKGECYLFDLAAFYAKWLTDIRDTQRPSGSIPDVVPSYWVVYTDGVTWPSSYIIIPHMLYNQYGDSRILQKHYDSMKKWTDYMVGFLEDGLIHKNTYGDWCVPPESLTLIHSSDPHRNTDGALISTAYFYHDLRLMSKSARLLGKVADAECFDRLAEKVKTAFNGRFLNLKTGVYDNGTQTSSVLSLAFGLVPDKYKAAVFTNLVDKIVHDTKGHIGTGLVGGQYLMRVLSDHGRPDLAYAIATQKTYPSWGYMIANGATTIWELWNGNTADPGMNSGNHVMLIGDLYIWFYEYLAGIRPDSERPGFKHMILRPTPVGELTHVKASYESPYGPIETEWHVQKTEFTFSVRIPANTSATVFLPCASETSVTESGQVLKNVNGITNIRTQENCTVFDANAGSYQFRTGELLVNPTK